MRVPAAAGERLSCTPRRASGHAGEAEEALDHYGPPDGAGRVKLIW